MALLLLGLVALSPALVQAQGASLLQRLRDLLGIQRPLAVAGSRSPSLGEGLCVISPWPAGTEGTTALALTPSGVPPIATSAPLAELRILRDGQLIGRLQASSRDPILTPLAWPGAPIPPGGSVELVLRPLRSSDAVRLRLRRAGRGDAPAVLRQATDLEGLLQGVLAGDPGQRRQAVALIAAACRPSAP